MNRQGGRTFLLLLGIVFTIILLGEASVLSQEKFPKKPISVIVPYAAGSGTDMEMRGIIPFVQKHLGVALTVVNLPGAQSKIGMSKAWNSSPDGYTLVILGIPAPIVVEKIFDADYKTKDFSHVYAWSISNPGLFVHAEAWKTFEEFVNAARKKTLSASVSGWGSVAHLAGLALADEFGFQVKWVPYEGGANTLAPVAGKHVDFTINFIPSAIPLVKAEKIRPILIFADSHDAYPGVPIPKDLVHKIDVIAAIRGVAAPPNSPPERMAILESAFAKAVKDPEFQEWTRKRQITLFPLDGKQFAQNTLSMYKTVEKYSKLVKELSASGIK